MANRAQIDNIRIVGDFVCETIPITSMPDEKPAARGKSAGIHVIAEFVVDLRSCNTAERKEDFPQRSIGNDDTTKPVDPVE